ncbi:MAG: DUF4252 domain-containing protein [Bacteroidetes bacterium]|jgi:hypothetical protein|nr:DUF4252 domain-containing protein [Bacteroidota bacterium]
MRTVLLCFLLAVLGFVHPVQAQDDVTNDLTSDPGYIDLNTVESWFGDQPKVEVNIKGALLELVAEASRYEDPELADLLTKLRAIQVRGYDLSPSGYGTAEARMQDLGQQLEDRGWDTVVRVREDDEYVNMFVRVSDGAIAGLMVMTLAPGDEESFFVNIVGEIDPQQIGRIGRTFDIDPLDDTNAVYQNRNQN